MDEREWDDKAETSVVCEGVSVRGGEGDGEGVWIEKGSGAASWLPLFWFLNL